jgi:hypothetical protein
VNLDQRLIHIEIFGVLHHAHLWVFRNISTMPIIVVEKFKGEAILWGRAESKHFPIIPRE